VFTAHPTEAIRRTVMFALRRIFITSTKLNDMRLGRDERGDIRQAIKQQIQVLWKTDEVRLHKPTVEDEIRNGLYYFHESLFEAVPQTYRYLEKAIRRVYASDATVTLPVVPGGLLQFGSWIGGDRDGNPYVKPATTVQALRMHMREILVAYMNKVDKLGSRLTHSERLCGFSDTFLESLAQDSERFPETFKSYPKQFIHEPYRRKLAIMHHRLVLNLVAVKERLEHPEIGPATQTLGYACEQELLCPAERPDPAGRDLWLLPDAPRYPPGINTPHRGHHRTLHLAAR